jgi:hypothetical protein
MLSVAVGGSSLYYTTGSPYEAYQLPLAGGTAKPLGDPKAVLVAWFDGTLYLSGQPLVVAPKGETVAQTTTAVTIDLAADAGGAFAVSYDRTGMGRYDLASRQYTTLPVKAGTSNITDVVGDGEFAYAPADNKGTTTTLFRVSAKGQQDLATVPGGSSGVFVDQTHVFLTTADGGIFRVPKDGSAAAEEIGRVPAVPGGTTATSTLSAPAGDDAHIYVADRGTNRILAFPKCGCP